MVVRPSGSRRPAVLLKVGKPRSPFFGECLCTFRATRETGSIWTVGEAGKSQTVTLHGSCGEGTQAGDGVKAS